MYPTFAQTQRGAYPLHRQRSSRKRREGSDLFREPKMLQVRKMFLKHLSSRQGLKYSSMLTNSHNEIRTCSPDEKLGSTRTEKHDKLSRGEWSSRLGGRSNGGLITAMSSSDTSEDKSCLMRHSSGVSTYGVLTRIQGRRSRTG